MTRSRMTIRIAASAALACGPIMGIAGTALACEQPTGDHATTTSSATTPGSRGDHVAPKGDSTGHEVKDSKDAKGTKGHDGKDTEASKDAKGSKGHDGKDTKGSKGTKGHEVKDTKDTKGSKDHGSKGHEGKDSKDHGSKGDHGKGHHGKGDCTEPTPAPQPEPTEDCGCPGQPEGPVTPQAPETPTKPTTPVVTTPVVNKPVVTKPVVTKPVVTKPVVSHPATVTPQGTSVTVHVKSSATTATAVPVFDAGVSGEAGGSDQLGSALALAGLVGALALVPVARRRTNS